MADACIGDLEISYSLLLYHLVTFETDIWYIIFLYRETKYEHLITQGMWPSKAYEVSFLQCLFIEIVNSKVDIEVQYRLEIHTIHYIIIMIIIYKLIYKADFKITNISLILQDELSWRIAKSSMDFMDDHDHDKPEV